MRESTQSRTGALEATSLQHTLQRALGALWIIDALLQCQPVMFTKAFVTQIITPTAIDQPTLVGHPITWAAHLIEPHVAVFNACAVLVQLLLGVGLMRRSTVKLALAGSCVWGLTVWWVGEGLGMLLTTDASPLTGAPGAAAVYVVAAIVLWPTDAASGGSVASLGWAGDRGARSAWAVVWLSGAWLWLQPAQRAPDAIRQALMGAPSGAGWLSAIEHSAGNVAGQHGALIAQVLAVSSLLIGVGVLFERGLAAALACGTALSVAYWILGQGLGGIFTGSATDPGTGPAMLILAGTLYQPRPAAQGAPAPSGRRPSESSVALGRNVPSRM